MAEEGTPRGPTAARPDSVAFNEDTPHDIAGNKVVEMAVLTTINSVKEGQTIAEPLEKQSIFPPMVVQMIEVGENSGALDTMLNKIADFYDEEVDTAVSALTSLLEPALMVFLGITIGFVVVAMYLPIFKMAGTIE